MFVHVTACVYPNITIILLHLCQAEGDDSVFLFHELSTDREKWQTRTSIRLCLSGAGMDGFCFSSLKDSGLAHDKIFAGNTLRSKDARKIFRKTARQSDLASCKSSEIPARTKRNLSIPNPVKSYICIKIATTKYDFCRKIVIDKK